MAEIRIEGKPVAGQLAGHLYLVFVDDNGTEYVIRGGPDDEHPETWIENGPWGHIVIQTGLLIYSRDQRELPDGTVETREQRGSTVIDLKGRDPYAVWDQMMQHAAGIAAAGLDYDLFGTGDMQNSNSVVASVLHNAGIDVGHYLPMVSATAQASYPGFTNLLEFDYHITPTPLFDASDMRIAGFDGNDTFGGGAGDDILEGGAGSDHLDGGAGTDVVDGGFGDDVIVANLDGADDTYEGGFGTDTIAYQYAHGNSTIRLLNAPELPNWSLLHPFGNRHEQSDFGIQISGARGANGEIGFGTDGLDSIEKAAVEAGDGADTLVVDESSQGGYIAYIDFGGQAQGAFDTIDLTRLTLGATVDLSRDALHWEAPGLVFGNYWTYKYDLTVRNAEAVLGGSGTDILVGGVLAGNLEEPSFTIDMTSANGRHALDADTTYLLDGGAGNDFIVLAGGKGSVAFGGSGRDYIFNSSRGGVIYGDTVDGVGVSDSLANADKIVFAPGVTLMDAGVHDQLVLGSGLRLTGGIDSGQRVNGAVVYNDKLAFGISYRQSGSDLLIYDRFGSWWSQLMGDAADADDDVFVVRNFSIADNSSGWGFAQISISGSSKLGLSFKEDSPLDNALQLTAGLLQGWALTSGSFLDLVRLSLIDAAFTAQGALALNAKSASWAVGGGTAMALQRRWNCRVAAANDNELGVWRGAPFRRRDDAAMGEVA